MSRLTVRDEYDYIHNRKGDAFTYTDIRFCGDCYVGEVIDKLADYEDLEERGLLLRLPSVLDDDLLNTLPTLDKKEIIRKPFDRVVERLEQKEEHCLEMHDWNGQTAICDAIEIVKEEGGIE